MSRHATIFHLFAAISFLSSHLAYAANDWTRACRGSCAYESGDGTNTAWSSIVIDGTPDIISDLTTAAGWSIMDCKPSSTNAQEIRIVCTNPDAGCDDLFLGGTENTIARLPEECSGGPFARVVRTWTAEDQTFSVEIARELQKRDLPKPEVLSLEFDFDFGAIPESRGTVSLTATATTNPIQRSKSQVASLKRSLTKVSHSARFPSHLVERDIFADFISGNQIVPSSQAQAAPPTGNNTVNKFSANWDKDWNHTFDLIDVQKQFTVIDSKLSCPANGDIPAFDAALKLDVDADVKVTLSVGFIISGSIIPPKISKAAFTAALNGGAQAVFKLKADVTGKFDTGLIPLYDSDYSGMSIPGIISVGPRFSINAQAVGTLGVTADATINACYTLPNLQMVYPQDQGDSSANADQNNQSNPLQLSIGGSASLTGTVSAHMIPRLEVGVTILSGLAKSSVFVQLDGYGSLDMSLQAKGAASTTIETNPSATTQNVAEISAISASTSASTPSDSAAPTTTEEAAAEPSPTEEILGKVEGDDVEVYSGSATSTAITEEVESSPPVEAAVAVVDTSSTGAGRRPSISTKPRVGSVHASNRVYARDNNIDYSGCVDINMGVAIVAGADGKLLSFWKDSVKWDLFRHEWDIYTNCFGGASKRSIASRRETSFFTPALEYPGGELRKRDIMDNVICPLLGPDSGTAII